MTNEQQVHILIVDDEELNLEIISEYLSDCNYKISLAEDGFIAWSMLEQNPESYDIILLDRMMPNMSGMEVLERITQHEILKDCPVIFQTAKASNEEISQGMDAGAYYYLTKPFTEKVLLSVVKTAVKDRLRFKELLTNLNQTQQCLSQTQQSIDLIKSVCFDFQTLEQARSIALFVSNTCPESEKVVLGLTELMINAIEHGNLNISYQEKSSLNDTGSWEAEVNKRLLFESNLGKVAQLKFTNNNGEIQIIITDQGEGFDWQNYLNFNPDRVMDNHGRGIAIANKLSFKHIEYKGNGNQVYAYV